MYSSLSSPCVLARVTLRSQPRRRSQQRRMDFNTPKSSGDRWMVATWSSIVSVIDVPTVEYQPAEKSQNWPPRSSAKSVSMYALSSVTARAGRGE